MTEVEPMIASAIVVPESIEPTPDPAAEPPGPGASLKRRQSSTSENDSKRPRLSRDGSTDSPVSPKVEDDRREARRKNGQVEERKRGQRLFGALLGTLAQRATPSTSKRRAEIEQRQKQKLKQQTEEDLQRRQERQEELRAARKRQQVQFDEQNMRLRHSNLLNMAYFLSTNSEPKLYYKPYKLREEHELQIKRQIEEVQVMIEDELYDFERKRREHDTPSEARAPPKTGDETMEDAPSTAHELSAAQQELSQKHLDTESSVSTLINDHPNQAMTDAAPEPHTQHGETMENEPATAGKDTDKKYDEQDNSRAIEEEANSNSEDTRYGKEEAMKNAGRGDKDTTTNAETETQAEADTIDEHHGEMMVEAEEDTVIY